MPPAAILFDLDDTLADRAAGLRRYARFFAEDFGARLLPNLTRTIHETLIAVDDHGSLIQAEALCAALPWRSPIEPQVLFDHWAERFGEAAVAFDDVEEVLRDLQRRQIRMGLVTNGGAAMQRSKIAALGLDPYMAAIVVSAEVDVRKPDTAIFRRALSDLGCAASEAWFVGDHPDLDVRGGARGRSSGLLGANRRLRGARRSAWPKTGPAERPAEAPGRLAGPARTPGRSWRHDRRPDPC